MMCLMCFGHLILLDDADGAVNFEYGALHFFDCCDPVFSQGLPEFLLTDSFLFQMPPDDLA